MVPPLQGRRGTVARAVEPHQALPPSRAVTGSRQVMLLAGAQVRCPRGSCLSNRDPAFSLQVAHQLQPSVVWIGDTEKTFYKKVPSAERMVRVTPAVIHLALSFL